MSTLLQGVLLRPLPVAEQSRLLGVRRVSRQDPTTQLPLTQPAFRFLRDHNTTFTNLAGVDYSGVWRLTAGTSGNATIIGGGVVTGEFFQTLGVEPYLGRMLEPRDDLPGAEKVVVISYGLWRSRYGGLPGAVGQVLRLWGVPYRIVGVAPRGFEYPREAAIWAPVTALRPNLHDDLNANTLELIGRLRPGATAGTAAEDIGRLLQAWLPAGVERPDAITATVPFWTMVVGDERVPVYLLFCASLTLLAIAGANLTSLLLGRAIVRRPETAVRAALGASPRDLLLENLIECATLGIGGAATGLAVAFGLIRVLMHLAPGNFPRLDEVGISWFAVLVALSLTVIVLLLAGMAPIRDARRTDIRHVIGSGGFHVGSSTASGRARQVLVAGQVGLSVVVLVLTGMVAHGMKNLQGVDPQIDHDRLTIAQVGFLSSKWTTAEGTLAVVKRLADALRATPEIEAVALTLAPPFSGTGGYDVAYSVEGQTKDISSSNPYLNFEAVDSGYFPALGVTVRGRRFGAVDGKASPPVVIVSDRLARAAWPGQDPLGKRLKFDSPDSPEPWREVVGVASDTRYRRLEETTPTVYLPVEQQENVPIYLLVQGRRRDFPALSMALRRVTSQVDPDLAIVSAESFDQRMAQELVRPRLIATLLGLFACAAIALTGIGVFGVAAAFVSSHRRELAIRMALGASPEAVTGHILLQTMRTSMLGAAIGVGAALALGRILSSQLYNVRAVEVSVLAPALGIVVLGVLLALYAPIRNAVRTHPHVVLRDG